MLIFPREAIFNVNILLELIAEYVKMPAFRIKSIFLPITIIKQQQL